MNCDKVNSHLPEMARRELMDSALRAACQAHLVDCVECRERITELESLQRTLRLTAEADRRLEASPAVEQNLLVALRTVTVRTGSAWWASALLWRCAALLLVASLALTYQGWRSRRIDTRSARSVAVSTPVAVTGGTSRTGVTNVVTVPVVRQPRNTRQMKKADRSGLGGAPANSNIRSSPVATRDESEEVLTDYLFLNPGQRLDPLERGQLIRVLVPRSTLGSFGFPVNPERAMMPVKADLVVGEDGLARAIRFIK